MRKRGNWSVEELQKLREQFGRCPLSQLVRDLNRTEAAVMQRARLSFSGRPKTGELSRQDETELRGMVGISDLETMSLVLGRKKGEVLKVLRRWARQRKRGRFQPWEVEFLKRNYATRPDWAVMLVLGREFPPIQKRVRELCLGKDPRVESVPIPQLEKVVEIQPRPRIRMPRWTPAETRALEEAYPHDSNLEIARFLGRSVKSVISKANELGLRKSERRLTDMGRENVEVRHRRNRR